MQITLKDETVNALLDDIFQNYPEYSSGNALKCTDFDYAGFKYEFIDTEDGKKYTLTLKKARAGFALLLDTLINQPDQVGFNPFDPSEYDCGQTDMLLQLSLLGEVIYG